MDLGILTGVAAMTKLWMAYGQKEDSDSKPRHKTNDHEIEALLIQSACAQCVILCPDTVCQSSVIITDCGVITDPLSRISWH